jgi:hypothetical protein
MSNYIEEKLKEFRDEIYGENDALFDRKGNNVSQQVENFILQALQEQEERIIKKIKSLPRYTFLTDKRDFTKQDVISREAVIKILNQDKLL